MYTNATMVNSTIKYNTSKKYGGGIYIKHKTNVSIKNCSISHNVGEFAGGAFISEIDKLSLENVIFYNNTAKENGGSLRIQMSEHIII